MLFCMSGGTCVTPPISVGGEAPCHSVRAARTGLKGHEHRVRNKGRWLVSRAVCWSCTCFIALCFDLTSIAPLPVPHPFLHWRSVFLRSPPAYSGRLLAQHTVTSKE